MQPAQNPSYVHPLTSGVLPGARSTSIPGRRPWGTLPSTTALLSLLVFGVPRGGGAGPSYPSGCGSVGRPPVPLLCESHGAWEQSPIHHTREARAMDSVHQEPKAQLQLPSTHVPLSGPGQPWGKHTWPVPPLPKGVLALPRELPAGPDAPSPMLRAGRGLQRALWSPGQGPLRPLRHSRWAGHRAGVGSGLGRRLPTQLSAPRGAVCPQVPKSVSPLGFRHLGEGAAVLVALRPRMWPQGPPGGSGVKWETLRPKQQSEACRILESQRGWGVWGGVPVIRVDPTARLPHPGEQQQRWALLGSQE